MGGKTQPGGPENQSGQGCCWQCAHYLAYGSAQQLVAFCGMSPGWSHTCHCQAWALSTEKRVEPCPGAASSVAVLAVTAPPPTIQNWCLGPVKPLGSQPSWDL